MFKSKVSEDASAVESAELRELLSGERSRFQVTNILDNADGKITLPRFDVENYAEMHSAGHTPKHGHSPGTTPLPDRSPQHNTYVYDTKSANQNLYQLTREVLPRLEHYKDDASVNRAQRPTLDELHQDADVEKTQQQIEDEERELQGKIIKFGWLDGVFMRCLLNIWGVMLFLRLSWVIGQAGVGEGVVIICLANLVTVVTTISMSAVCTNGQIKGGGVYYMISRALGPQFGGAIGLMFTLANSIAVAMYIVGFCESLQDLLRTFGMTLIDGGTNDIRAVGIVTLILILVLAFVGMDWVTRTQMFLLIVLVFSQIDFIIGSIIGPKTNEEIAKGFVGYSVETFENNFGADYQYFEGHDHDFFSVFSVFFPAVTGIVAGANLSGDLKDPSSAIPKGTLLAIFVTFLSYVGYALMMGGCALRRASGNVSELVEGSLDDDPLSRVLMSNCTETSCKYGLQNDNQMMELISLWGPLIYGGCFAATLSSAIASLVGAPRVLQALAKDKLYPFIGFFSKGYGANNDPVRGYILVFCISLGCILIAQLNAIAPLLSNFFLAAYALINFSVFHASISKSPGWRPAFKYYNAWVSLLGTLLCIAVMFLISWWTALITFVVVVTLYLYVSYRKPDVNWGSSTQAQCYSLALRSVLELNGMEEHVKNYRPQILVLSGQPAFRPTLVQFANLITKGLSLLVCGHVDLKESYSQRVVENLTKRAYRWMNDQKIKGFFATSFDGNMEAGSRALMQSVGVGRLRPNMLLMGYKRDWATCSHQDLLNYFNTIHNALDRHLALGILRLPGGLDFSELVQDSDLMPTDSDKEKEKQKKRKKKTSKMEDEPLTPEQELEAELRRREKERAAMMRSAFHGNIVRRQEKTLLDPQGHSVSRVVTDNFMHFQRRQKSGNIDVWWLYDDGGLTLLIPYILSTRSIFSECKLRIFSLCVNKEELDEEQRNLAALLSKFRISYSDVIVIPDIMKKAQTSTKIEFEAMIQNFRIRDDQVTEENKYTLISDSEFEALKERSNRHMRLRELLKEHSQDATFVVMTLPMPRKGTVSAALYLAWLELLTKGMPPYLIVRGNQNSVLTFYS